MARRSTIRSEEPISVDGAGRVVIPKPVRRQLGIRRGTKLKVSIKGTQLVLEPIGERTGVMERNGILVATGSLVGEWVDHRDLREERARKHGGW
jgi:AbrB family looped-hinge helix DNA binding protein